jgi:prepilin-type N-terminal cleavage/methylation domain-containing protein
MQREHLDARAAHRSESGFTLIELMMVVFIIAILIAVLIPVFFGAAARAKDRAMQSSLRNGLTTAKTVYSDHAKYTEANAAALNTAAGTLTFVGGNVDPTGQNTVSVDTVSDSYIVLSGESKTGECFFVSDDALGTGTLYAKLGGSGGCRASYAPIPGDAAWQKTW